MPDEFHRFSGDYYSASEWREQPETAARVRRVLGNYPPSKPDHRLPPLAVPSAPKPLPPGPRPGVSLLADLAATEPITREVLTLALANPALRVGLADATLWGFRRNQWHRVTLDQVPVAELDALTVGWELLSLPGNALAQLADAASERLAVAQHLASALEVAITRADDPSDAARRTATLVGLKQRFARSVELRLGSATSPWLARTVWRTLYDLGLTWGHLDLFHWQRLFTVSSLAKPGYFLPERAVEGEVVPGLLLSFELPSCPLPVETFDRMALLLAHLKEQLGGRPLTADGRELDSERVEAEREVVAQAVSDMVAAGIAPGSAEALAFF